MQTDFCGRLVEIVGRRFASWSEFEAHLSAWTREVTDVRIHGTTGEAPATRFERDELQVLRPLAGTAVYDDARLGAPVGASCAIEVDGNAYSVPWRLIGERVHVGVELGTVRVRPAGSEIAVHTQLEGRHGRVVDNRQLVGVAGAKENPIRIVQSDERPPMAAVPSLLRPLSEYEAILGGGF